ncbi:PP2C family protein-serine/threonine phosphatase [Aneurinibacillus sp. Ricciae_BoGa-3]|uniref:PP2C family protein-serine/threonine phosphatase n=1 Tax=Aneurinibacillus sp. Ricciae_BoGa-3 TaxID=3022697 RepID=UPI0023413A57|nr:PP2C family protein-serine/threonine phosphatase [Aneurinibacillus sp. Ricciae_BoGa-3]WCK53692.1 PP2C family protein-serine/threonine phosphatase [Aneurinibacillus sp. Ricciae_BoGa-3]
MKQVMEYYEKIMLHFLQNQGEHQLYAGQQLSKQLIEKDVSPEEILSIHLTAMKKNGFTLSSDWEKSFQFLLEIMVSFGMAYQERQSLRIKKKQFESEINVAISMQKNLYPSNFNHNFHDIDLGFISTPAREMSGDFYYFINHDRDRLGVLIADIVGKGIPAALCMSMIKYAMDTLERDAKPANLILDHLNRLMIKNADPSLFVTMFYTIYDPLTSILSYSSAGHEPALYYDSRADKFSDLNTKGLILGVDSQVEYKEKSLQLHPGDYVILYTDGVTEFRRSDMPDDNHILREALSTVDKTMTSQEIVEKIYQYIINKKDYQLDDDHTIVMIRKT